MTTRSDFGQWAEINVAQHLKLKGYLILDKNYQKKWGEIDIIAKKGGVLIFVEVKANKKEIAGFEPELRVNSENSEAFAYTKTTGTPVLREKPVII